MCKDTDHQVRTQAVSHSVIVTSNSAKEDVDKVTNSEIMKNYTRNGNVVREKDAMKDLQNIHAQKILV